MRLTILVPFIGTFLLFNQATEAALAWPDFLKNDLGSNELERLPAQNLYFTYFGLCLLGVGSILFALVCPSDINDQPDINSYVVNTPAASSAVIAKDNFGKVLDLKFGRMGGASEVFDTTEYPAELESDFHALMQELYGAVDLEEVDEVPEVMMSTGYLDFTNLAEMVWRNARATWAITMPFYDAAPKFARDIAFLKHRSLDYSKFPIRLFIATVYLVGFVLLAKPSVHIFVLLIMRFWFGAPGSGEIGSPL